MRYYLDFYKLEDLKNKAQILEETTKNMRFRMENVKNNITSINSGESINKFEEIMELQNTVMQALENDLNIIYNKIGLYTSGLREYDIEVTAGKNYEIETDDIRKQVKEISNVLNNTEYTKKDYLLDNFESDYSNNKSQYENVDSSINISQEYEDDFITQDYIRRRRIEIDEDIYNHNHNMQIYEEAMSLLRKLED